MKQQEHQSGQRSAHARTLGTAARVGLVVVLAWLALGTLSTRARAQGTTPLKVSLVQPLAVPWSEKVRVTGLSLNLIYGATDRMAGIELGLVNLENDHTLGLQFGGLVNIVEDGGAIQAAGLVNVVKGDFVGLQVAGIGNWVSHTGSFGGIQIGLLNNTVGDITGLQIAPILNLNGKTIPVKRSGYVSWTEYPNARTDGVQISFGNLAQILHGVQIGLFANHASILHGLQLSLFLNGADKAPTGAQIGGLLNFSGDVSGLQISAINIAKDTNGLQVGFVNVARKLNGIQIGILNIAYGNALPFFPGINMGF